MLVPVGLDFNLHLTLNLRRVDLDLRDFGLRFLFCFVAGFEPLELVLGVSESSLHIVVN